MALEITRQVESVTGVQPDSLPHDLLQGQKPILFKGLVKDWPVVQASGDFDQFQAYLLAFYTQATVNLNKGDPSIKGRFFYNDSFSGLNVETKRAPFPDALTALKEVQEEAEPPLIYVGSTTVDTCLPGFRADNDLSVPDSNPLVSLWLGNQSRIAAHQDLPDNLACVVAGKRRFTLFPPDQLENLYIGPIDITPAGQAVSMVDFHQVDHQKFPKFQTALEHAFVAEMDPGDALFIPSMWWHHVEGQHPYNMLVNYWWRSAPAYMGPPQAVLEHAFLTLRALPQEQKNIWRDIFETYIFSDQTGKWDHIPEDIQGLLKPLDEATARRIRAILLQKLNR